jgi:hypothetical protein
LLLVLLVLNVVLNNPLGNSRLWAGVVIFALLSTALDLRRPLAIAAMTSALLILYTIIFPYADSFRRVDSTGPSFESPLALLQTDGSFSAFQTAANGVEYLSVAPHTYGEQIAGGVLTLVPRSLWVGKPIDTGSLIDPRFNRASTLWTEAQVDFGLIGVFILFIVLGAIVAQLDRGFEIAGTGSIAGLLVPLLAPFYVFLLRGSLSAAVGALLPLLFFILLSTRLEPGGEQRGSL